MRGIVSMLCFAILLAAGNVFTFTGDAVAGQSCRSGYYFDTRKLECVKQVKITISAQDKAAASGPQWGPVNGVNCEAASSEMNRSAASCRGLDARKAYDAVLKMVVNGKLLEDCAKCCRQLREGMNRWRLCHKKGFAPAPDYATARRSAKLMNCGFTY